MIMRFTKNIAINVETYNNEMLVKFYKNLGLETKEYGYEFTGLHPSPYKCYIVSWELTDEEGGKVCLQFETDNLQEARSRVESLGGKIIYYGSDPESNGKNHFWFRDPVGNLVNIIEIAG